MMQFFSENVGTLFFVVFYCITSDIVPIVFVHQDFGMLLFTLNASQSKVYFGYSNDLMDNTDFGLGEAINLIVYELLSTYVNPILRSENIQQNFHHYFFSASTK